MFSAASIVTNPVRSCGPVMKVTAVRGYIGHESGVILLVEFLPTPVMSKQLHSFDFAEAATGNMSAALDRSCGQKQSQCVANSKQDHLQEKIRANEQRRGKLAHTYQINGTSSGQF